MLPISQYLLKQRNRQSKKKPLLLKSTNLLDVFQLLNYLNCNSRAKTAPKPKSCLIKLSTNIQVSLQRDKLKLFVKAYLVHVLSSHEIILQVKKL